MSEQKKLPQGVTIVALNEFIKANGQVFPVRVKKDDKEYVGLFRKPTLAIMSAAAAAGASDPLRSGEVLYRSCKLAVDDAMDKDEEVHLAAIGGVNKLFKVLEAEVGEAFVAE